MTGVGKLTRSRGGAGRELLAIEAATFVQMSGPRMRLTQRRKGAEVYCGGRANSNWIAIGVQLRNSAEVDLGQCGWAAGSPAKLMSRWAGRMV